MRIFNVLTLSVVATLISGPAFCQHPSSFSWRFEFGARDQELRAEREAVQLSNAEPCRLFDIQPGELASVWAREWCGEYATHLVPRLGAAIQQALAQNREQLRCRLGIHSLEIVARYLHQADRDDVLQLIARRPEERREILRLRLRLNRDWPDHLLQNEAEVRSVRLNSSISFTVHESVEEFFRQILDIAPNGKQLPFVRETNCI